MFTILFAVLAGLITAVTAVLAYRGVRDALSRDFEQRLERIAGRAAGQIAPADVRDARARSSDSAPYAALQTLLGPLPATADLLDAAIVDSARVTLVDARGREEVEGMPSTLDSLAHETLDRAFAGRVSLSPPYGREHDVRRAAAAPIRDARGVAGVVAIEAEATYLPVLDELRRTLALVTIVSLLAIAVLAALFARVATSTSHLERRLSRAENLAAMGRLTATLAHEIKNPLAVIRGSAERLGKLEPEARRMAEFVIEETDRLTGTVGRYLQFARGESAEGGEGDALVTLEQTLNLLEGEIAERRVTLARTGTPPASAPVGLDNDSLKQVYLNLMLNALEAMPGGGRLGVDVAERSGRIEIAIEDGGPGIPTETLRKIGSPFFTTKVRGSGLGLFLTRRLIQSAGGQLEIRSEVGRGTTCVVRWPRRKGSNTT